MFYLFSGAFDYSNVTHVGVKVDPVRDLGIISEDLRLKDKDMLTKAIEKLKRVCVCGNDKKLSLSM